MSTIYYQSLLRLHIAQTDNQEDDASLVIVPLEYQRPVGLFPKLGRSQFRDEPIIDTAAVPGPSFFSPFADVIQNLEGKINLFTFIIINLLSKVLEGLE